MSYYQRLRDLKEDAELTQKDVSKLIGVSMNHYGKYERGEIDLPLEKALILADYYNVSLDYITGRTNNKIPFTKLNQSSVYMMNLFQKLSPINRERIEERMLEMIYAQEKL